MKKTFYLLATMIVGATAAHPAFVIDRIPAALPGTEIVKFNQPGLIEMGPLVQGLLSESEVVIDFYGAGEDLKAGMARVEAVDGGLTQMSVAMDDPGLALSAYQFTLDMVNDGMTTIGVYDRGFPGIFGSLCGRRERTQLVPNLRHRRRLN